MCTWIPANVVGRDGALAHVLMVKAQEDAARNVNRHRDYEHTEMRVIKRKLGPYTMRAYRKMIATELRARGFMPTVETFEPGIESHEKFLKMARARLRNAFIARYWAERRRK